MYSGVIENLPIEDYHLDDSLSHSKLVKMATGSPKHLKYYLDTKQSEKSHSLEIGTIFHDLTLQPEMFKHRTIIEPKPNLRTNVGKETAEKLEVKAEKESKVVVWVEDYIQAKAMSDSVLAHPKAKELLENSWREVSYFTKQGDARIRIRPDALPKEGNSVLDLKSTKNGSKRGFYGSVWKYRYDIQAALYLDILQTFGIERLYFVFVVVESFPPYAVGLYVLSTDVLNKARTEYKELVSTYQECMRTGYWPGYTEDIIELGKNDVTGVPQMALEEF